MPGKDENGEWKRHVLQGRRMVGGLLKRNPTNGNSTSTDQCTLIYQLFPENSTNFLIETTLNYKKTVYAMSRVPYAYISTYYSYLAT